MKQLKTAISQLVRSVGIENGILQQKALEIWGDVVGSKIAKNTSPDGVEHGILRVKTSNSVWRHELVSRRKTIIDKLNTSLGKNVIKEIRFI